LTDRFSINDLLAGFVYRNNLDPAKGLVAMVSSLRRLIARAHFDKKPRGLFKLDWFNQSSLLLDLDLAHK
jgi:hypothetical protein